MDIEKKTQKFPCQLPGYIAVKTRDSVLVKKKSEEQYLISLDLYTGKVDASL